MNWCAWSRTFFLLRKMGGVLRKSSWLKRMYSINCFNRISRVWDRFLVNSFSTRSDFARCSPVTHFFSHFLTIVYVTFINSNYNAFGTKRKIKERRSQRNKLFAVMYSTKKAIIHTKEVPKGRKSKSERAPVDIQTSAYETQTWQKM